MQRLNQIYFLLLILTFSFYNLASQTVSTYSILSTAYNRTNNTFFTLGTVDSNWYLTRMEDLVIPNDPSSVINYANNPTYVVPNSGNNFFTGIINDHSINLDPTTNSLGLKLITYRTYFTLPNLNLTNNRYSLSFKMSADDAVDNVKLNGTQKGKFLDSLYNNIPSIPKPYMLNIPVCDTDFVSGQNFIDITVADAGALVSFYAEIILNETTNVAMPLQVTATHTIICAGETTVLSVTGSLSYVWYDGSTAQNISITPSTTNYYSVTGVNNSCSSKDSILVQVIIPVSADFTIDDSDSCNSNLGFRCVNASSLNNWTFSNGISSSNTCDFSSQFSSSGNYNVIHITNPNTACADTVQKSFIVNQPASDNIQLPNVFTPNDDNSNERFDFSAFIKCDSYKFEVFNRWGLSILKTENSKQKFWDGRTTSGEKVTDGTYFYILTTATKSFKGTVNVFR